MPQRCELLDLVKPLRQELCNCLNICRFGMLGKYMGFLQNDQHNTGSLASWCQARHGGGSLLARVVGGGHGLCIATALFAIPFWCLGGHTKPGRIWMCSPTPVHFQSVCYQPFSKHSSSTDLYSLLVDYLFVLHCKSLGLIRVGRFSWRRKLQICRFLMS